LTEYEISPLAYLAINSAHFVAFNLKNPEQGRAIIKNARPAIERLSSSKAKWNWDILLFEENSIRH
jgi:hypothetical protein